MRYDKAAVVEQPVMPAESIETKETTSDVEDFRISIRSSGNHFSFHDESANQLSAVLEGEVEGSSIDVSQQIGVDSSVSNAGNVSSLSAKKMEEQLVLDLGIQQVPKGTEDSWGGDKAEYNVDKLEKMPDMPFGNYSKTAEARMIDLMKEMGTFRNNYSMSSYNTAKSIEATEQKKKAKRNMSKRNKAMPFGSAPASFLPNASVLTCGSSFEESFTNGEQTETAIASRTEIRPYRHKTALAVSKSLDTAAWMRQTVADEKKCKCLSI